MRFTNEEPAAANGLEDTTVETTATRESTPTATPPAQEDHSSSRSEPPDDLAPITAITERTNSARRGYMHSATRPLATVQRAGRWSPPASGVDWGISAWTAVLGGIVLFLAGRLSASTSTYHLLNMDLCFDF
ncbi:hypothetical protein HDU90_004321 [Geranomyces variabilis]|nr:hypothetical protein HDU90_004321 [Geranomyces variabilis]